jgi:Na+/H+-translocating membrane pyrophosphatase
MRGGAIPLLVWALILGVLFAIHWAWTGDTLQTGTFGFAIGLVLAAAALTAAGSRDALRRGAPPPPEGAEAVPAASLGAPLAGLGLAAVGFGLVFGAFLVFIGAGMFVCGVAVAGRELAGERRARREWSVREPRP